MHASLDEFIKWAELHNWEIKRREGSVLLLPQKVVSRYTEIPQDLLRFLSLIDVCISSDERSWFICLNDYSGNSDIAFTWDEFERISLEAAEEDIEWKESIIRYWDRYLPIALSVRNGYSYYAMDVKENVGSIVYGYEPEFEEAECIADSFLEFIEMIMDNKIEF